MTTYEGWAEILESANSSIHIGTSFYSFYNEIAQYYFTLLDGQQYPPEYGGFMGENIFQVQISFTWVS